MDYFSCSLYHKSSAYKKFVPHINTTRPLISDPPQNNASTPQLKRTNTATSKMSQPQNDKIPIINLHFESANIPSDGVNTQDFLCVMSVFGKNGWEKYARTEANFSNFSRKWIQPITILGDNKLLRFELYQITSDLYSLRHQKYIGDCQAELKDILAKDIFKIDIRLSYEFTRFARGSNLKSAPRLIIKHRKLERNRKGSLFFKMTYVNQVRLPKLSFKPSHYFEIELVENDILVYRSNTVKLNPKSVSVFDTVDFNQQLHFGSILTPIRFKLHEVGKTDKVLFEFETTVDCLMEMSTMKYPIGDSRGFVVGEFDIFFIGENQRMQIDDLKINGISFQSIFAFDFSDGKKSSDTFRIALTEVFDSLNNISQLKPYTAFGFGCFPESHNVFTFNNSIAFRTMKKLFNSYYNCLMKIESTPKESKLTPVIKRAKRIAVEKWHECQAFSIVSIFTSGLNVVDFDEAVEAMVNCSQFPIIFLIITLNSSKNKFASLTCTSKDQYLKKIKNSENHESSEIDPIFSRKMIDVIFYGNTIMNQPSNLQAASKSVSKMIHDWGGVYNSLFYSNTKSFANLNLGKLPSSTSFDHLSGISSSFGSFNMSQSSKSYLALNQIESSKSETETEPTVESDNENEVYESKGYFDNENSIITDNKSDSQNVNQKQNDKDNQSDNSNENEDQNENDNENQNDNENKNQNSSKNENQSSSNENQDSNDNDNENKNDNNENENNGENENDHKNENQNNNLNNDDETNQNIGNHNNQHPPKNSRRVHFSNIIQTGI